MLPEKIEPMGIKRRPDGRFNDFFLTNSIKTLVQDGGARLSNV